MLGSQETSYPRTNIAETRTVRWISAKSDVHHINYVADQEPVIINDGPTLGQRLRIFKLLLVRV